jgi:hypothetical protein
LLKRFNSTTSKLASLALARELLSEYGAIANRCGYFSPRNEVVLVEDELRPVDAETAAPTRAPAILEFSVMEILDKHGVE